jgi:type II restriction enzyme
MRVTAANLVHAIGKLPRDIHYQYADASTPTKLIIERVEYPEGPIIVKRYGTKKNPNFTDAKAVSLSTSMIWRLANAIIPGKPINLERVFGSSYNSRSALEALLLHTPEFYTCKLDRLEQTGTTKKVKPGHKHMLYLPDEPHENGVMGRKEVDMQVSEVTVDVIYEGVTLEAAQVEAGLDIEQQRRHAQIQIALVLIGQQLGFRTWVAANDRSIEYAGRRIAEMESVIDSLTSEKVLSAYPEASHAARLIDCIWFRNGRLMPAVMEVEHSTGVTSGLTRMKGFYDIGPALRDVRWTIVAPDDLRDKVIQQANLEQFRPMDVRFFPYSAVEELYSLCQRRKPRGITDEFLDCYMERCLAA